ANSVTSTAAAYGVTTTPVKLGKSIQFNLATHGVEIADSGHGGQLDGFRNLTMQGWMLWTTLPGPTYPTLAKKEGSYICRTQNDCLDMVIWNGAATFFRRTIPLPGPRVANTWYHAACTYEAPQWDLGQVTQNGRMRLYWNGTELDPAGAEMV